MAGESPSATTFGSLLVHRRITVTFPAGQVSSGLSTGLLRHISARLTAGSLGRVDDLRHHGAAEFYSDTSGV
jgi:hypothetical protein